MLRRLGVSSHGLLEGRSRGKIFLGDDERVFSLQGNFFLLDQGGEIFSEEPKLASDRLFRISGGVLWGDLGGWNRAGLLGAIVEVLGAIFRGLLLGESI